jgi:magnesium transporter
VQEVAEIRQIAASERGALVLLAAAISPAILPVMSSVQQPLPGVAWFDISDPNSSELEKVAHRLRFHELQIEDCRHRPQRAKTEEHEHYIFCVLKHLRNDANFTFEDFDVFLTANELVTVHEPKSDILEKTRVRAEQGKVTDIGKIFYLLLDTIVDEYSPVLDRVADETAEIESIVLECPEPPVLARIFKLKRNLIEFRRAAAGMREVVNSLVRREGGILSDELDPYLRDVYDHVIRTTEFIETYRDVLSGALDIYLSAVANRTNEVMKVLTIWGTVALPMVILTGFFGMNLPLPWQNNPHGSLYSIGLMAATAAATLMYFKKKKWF